jgi:hypothetical protein
VFGGKKIRKTNVSPMTAVTAYVLLALGHPDPIAISGLADRATCETLRQELITQTRKYAVCMAYRPFVAPNREEEEQASGELSDYFRR